MVRRRRKWTRHYLLVEVLVSLALVALCLSPIMYTHVDLTAKMERRLVECLLQREADRLFWQVREQLYLREISWNAMNHGPARRKDYTLTLDPVTLTLPCGQRTYEATGVLFVKHHHEKQDFHYRLLCLDLELKCPGQSFPFHYQIFVERRGLVKEGSDEETVACDTD